VFESFADWSRWNIAPTAEVPVVRAGPPGGGPRADALRWGLIPSWSKDASFGARAINARSETVAEKPAFRSAFKRRRCLVPASGFYEWSGPKGARTAHLFALRDGQPFTFAGIWETWQPQQGDALETFSILTCAPNDLVSKVHDRMPVILPAAQRDAWLDPQVDDTSRLLEMLVPFEAELMETFPVGTYVNDARHQGPECARRVTT
jgi:putative SOS response-associated peptidase YedK